MILSLKECQDLFIRGQKDIPSQCERLLEKFGASLHRHESEKNDMSVAFQGMSPGLRSAAMAARSRGHLNHAQIQRRMTEDNKNSMFK
mmetsp:Transcript_3652/g.5395  ORF Transcript_3652/g.5395 Transcript_3652/m.5395 type:complete len:88 (+) Transcript_3652:203-466(+)|eukprot:CAMPEP_0118690034 /NCGR_PEP_ID=MMETSP0800-20121206/9842_1 /TAXON_ID=210618 ORGANISM="Striatella unipunctata, Strain CCMP2910" /NCGR_SAMPLE_ID=MMETSP0800 /ASSEMBLY_ACC=CAM_ASM_000638 /LENGTH=87 /DNA_ID=CAMNT_0006587541 /DNA_START=171 /DNA_END=434 /DNA_ORIENTATION=+